jgi:hypothetical protein
MPDPIRKLDVIDPRARRERIQAVDFYWPPLAKDLTDAKGLMPDRGAGFEMVGAS